MSRVFLPIPIMCELRESDDYVPRDFTNVRWNILVDKEAKWRRELESRPGKALAHFRLGVVLLEMARFPPAGFPSRRMRDSAPDSLLYITTGKMHLEVFLGSTSSWHWRKRKRAKELLAEAHTLEESLLEESLLEEALEDRTIRPGKTAT